MVIDPNTYPCLVPKFEASYISEDIKISLVYRDQWVVVVTAMT
ncbi:hypothetical protein [cyanobacterium endosymbiont of Epithemia turgida]|nr:hypothetical protein [cyanobacterium endosymbiont of Epithemia turgida]